MMSKQDGKASDGATGAQKRALSAWERDLLCNLILKGMKIQAETKLPFAAKTPEEVDSLVELYGVLSPRETPFDG